MVWETVKKEMTITRISVALIAILLCCFIAFGLTQKTENKANNEKGLEMLNLIREYLNKTEPHDGSSHVAHNTNPTTNPNPRKFYSISPSSTKSDHHNGKHNLDVTNSKHFGHLDHSTKNTSKNASDPKLDLIIVVNTKKQPEHKKAEIIDIKNTNTRHLDELDLNRMIFSKTVRVTKVEEVFEDLVARNVRRIIKEDRIERVQVAKNNKMEMVDTELGIKDLLSL